MNNDQRKRYLLKNTAIFALGSMGTKLIMFILVPIYTVVLSTKEFGSVDLIFTIGTVVVPILTLNMGESVMRFSLDKGASPEKIMSTGLLALAPLLIIGLLILPIINNITQIAHYAIYIYLYTISLGISQVLMSYLRGKEKLLLFSIGNVIQTLSIAVLNITFLVFFKQGIEGYLIAYILANTITVIYAFFTGNVYSVFKNFKIDLELSKKMILYSVVLIPNTFMWWIMNSSDRIMISTMIGVSENGIYAISYKLPSLLVTITGVFTQAWAYSAIKERESNDIERYNNGIYDKLVSVVVVIAGFMLVITKPFLSVYVENAYYEAWKYTPFLILGFVFMTLGSFIATSYTVHKDSKGYLISGTFGAVINIILNVLLIPVLNVFGAALSTCISYIIVYVYRVFDTKKYIKLNVTKTKYLFSFLILVFLGIAMFFNVIIGMVIQTFCLLLLVLINKNVLFKLIFPIKGKKVSRKYKK